MSLNLGLGLGLGSTTSTTLPPEQPLCDAIARKLMVTAQYDDQLLKIAPHVVYKRGRRNIVTVDAVLISREGHPVNRPTLRTYTLSDLSGITLTDEGFTVLAGFEADDPEYADSTICVVEAV